MHIAIIMDGNRRYAKKLMLEPWKGHEFGAKKVHELIDWCSDLEIDELTLYALSTENFESRSKLELDVLFKLFKNKFEELKNDTRLMDNGIRIRFIGRLEMFDSELQQAMQDIMEQTKENSNVTINFAVAYGGRPELIDAIKEIATDVKKGVLDVSDINESIIDKHVYNPSQPEIIIRTSGEKRLSNFLMWQSGYAELFFIDKMWPALMKEDLVSIMEDFKKRNRRFGK